MMSEIQYSPSAFLPEQAPDTPGQEWLGVGNFRFGQSQCNDLMIVSREVFSADRQEYQV
jgi:hypothetical protein